MKSIMLRVSDETADELLKRHGGQEIDRKTGEVLRDVPTPMAVVDLRANRASQHTIKVREFER